ncbi:LytR/AlgR family response regulator transcription factor [Allofournierella sp.]|uniref:LytR/AlgR family response regulator transcription factor n=1 Tax=Allofournierella sp. TaxID=1940256 RepID=UPI003AB75BE4
MIRAILLDDEEIGIHTLTRLLEQCGGVEVIGAYTDAVKGLVETLAQKPDVVFLDIEMPVLNGFEVAKQLAAANLLTKTVFVTAFDDYAVQAFELNSLDYLLKPVTQARLQKTIEKLRHAASTPPAEEAIDAAIQTARMKLNRVVINNNERLLLLDPLDILFFTTDQNGVRIVTERKAYTTKETLGYWEERMSGFDFFRCHKSFLVNLHKIAELHPMFNNTYAISIAGYGQTIPVSRRYSVALKEIMGI